MAQKWGAGQYADRRYFNQNKHSKKQNSTQKTKQKQTTQTTHKSKQQFERTNQNTHTKIEHKKNKIYKNNFFIKF